MTESLALGDATVTYSVQGSGAGLLVPWCNFPWPDMPFLDVLADQFRVVLASPRGYQASSWPAGTQTYTADLLVTDLLAVCDQVGIDTFSVLGYSLTAAMAGWLATASPRVDALVLGGFPLLGSYAAVLRGAALTDRGMQTLVLDGGDHVTTILRLGEVIEHVTNWLGQVTRSSGR